MKPLTVYTSIPFVHSASFYYRLEVPLRTAADLGLNVRSIVDQGDMNTPPESRFQALCESDVVLAYQPIGDVPLQNFQVLKSFLPSKREGEWKWPPSLVIESDDNLFNVSPLNRAFRTLGIRDMEGNDIPIGTADNPTVIGVVHNGVREIKWVDGENGFSLAKNRQSMSLYRRILAMADAVTCSTVGVKQGIEREVELYRPAQVFPNLVRFQDYEQVDLREDKDQIKILWQGGDAHYEDFYPLREAFGSLTRRYPEIHWIIWGAQYPWVNELIPAHRYTFKSWCAYQEYKLRLAMVGHDIAIAPLQDHVFNTCRSAIKWYEASVLKQPVATLAQNSAAYKQEIKDGETGLLFNDPQEFEDKLSLLIEDAKLRRTLGENAKDWVHENRDANKEVPKLVRFWEDLREQREREQPHVTDAEWEKIEAEAKAAEEAQVT